MNGIYDITDFGARGNGVDLDTQAIQKAIDSCITGGSVYFPPGKYLSGTLILRSNVNFFLSAGSILTGSSNLSDYNTGEPNPQMPGYNWESILFAKDVQNIHIDGYGKIEGQGKKFPWGAESYSLDEQEKMPPMKIYIRPSLIYFKNCTNIFIEDIKLHDSAQFTTLFENCQKLKLNNVEVVSRHNLNTDGFHMIACNDIHITNCILSCGDDAIVMNKSTERCFIHNCSISSRWAGIRIGPFSPGIFKDITVTDCIIHQTYGCAIKIQMGEGGLMENFLFRNITMNDVTGPISIRLAHFTGWQQKTSKNIIPGSIHNILFDQIIAVMAEKPKPTVFESPVFDGEIRSCICIEGSEGYDVEDVKFNNITIKVPGGGTIEEAQGKDFPVIDYRYPEYFLAGTPPAFALFARHVKGLVLNNIAISVEKLDMRPAIVLDKVNELDCNNIRPVNRSQNYDMIMFNCQRSLY